jgi:hypothetical protein
MDGPQSLYEFFEDEKDLFTLPGIEARFIASLAYGLVTMPIALPRLLKAKYTKNVYKGSSIVQLAHRSVDTKFYVVTDSDVRPDSYLFSWVLSHIRASLQEAVSQ